MQTTPDTGAVKMMSDDPDAEADELEGADEHTRGDGVHDYPLDYLMIRSESRTVHDVLRRIERGQIILDAEALVWDEAQQGRLIESVLMRIPLPTMYLAERIEGPIVVVDGQQRLGTLRRFVGNQMPLSVERPELSGKRFKDLDGRLQNRIEDTNLILYIIDAKVPERVRLDIFERVNGGVPLSRQQMRNCLYNGPGTRWLRDRVASPEFEQLFSRKSFLDMQKAMRDRELANRYAAFRVLGWEAYRGDMDQFLGDALTRLNALSDEGRAALAEEFDRGVANNVLLFDRMAFRRHGEGETKGSRFNVALFDVFCTALGRYDRSRVAASRQRLREMFFTLMAEERFTAAVAYGTNQTDRVRARFSRVAEAVQEVLGDP